MRRVLSFDSESDSEIARTDRNTAVLLGAMCGLLAHFLHGCRSCLGEIAGGHHAVLLEQVLDRGCDDVTHRSGGKEVTAGF